MHNTFSQSGNDSKWFLTKRQYKDYLVGQLTWELWILLQGLCWFKTRRTATRRSCRCLSSRVALRGWDGWWHHSPICPTIVFHFCTTAQLHNYPAAQFSNLKPLSYTTNRKVIKHLMTKTTLLIDKFSLLVDRGGGDVRRKRWLFCGSIFFYSKCTVSIGQCCNLLWRHQFSKCAVALQFVYMRVYFVFVLSWICPAGREEDMPAMPYTYFWSTSHGGVRITTHCARCALCNEIETMPHSDKKEEGSEAMRTWMKNIHTTILQNLPVCASPIPCKRFWELFHFSLSVNLLRKER